MAAVGGGLSASAVLTGVNTSTTARCRFPARPCTSRSQVRSEKRLRIGRRGTGDGKTASKGPRPVNIGLTLQEDPSLLRLLRIAEKHSSKREAGFDSSGSEEEDNFVGFGVVDSGRSLRSSRSASQIGSPLKPSLSPVEKPPPAPDLKEEKKDAAEPQVSPVKEIKPLYGKVVKRGERIRKSDEASASPGTQAKSATKSKLLVKFAVKKTTKEASPAPKTAKAEQGKGPAADSRQPAKALAKDQKVRKSVDVDLTNDEVQDLNTDGSSKTKAQQGQPSTAGKGTGKSLPVIRVLKDPQAELAGSASQVPVQNEGQTRKKQSKVVWTLTMVKDQGKEAAVKGAPAEVSKSPGPMLGKFVKRSRPAPQEEGSNSVGSPTGGNSLSSSSPSPSGQRRNPSHLLWIPQKRRSRDAGGGGGSATAVSPKPVGKQRRISKGAEGSPEEGAEAGRESGQEPSDQPAASSGDSMRRRRAHFKFKKRRSLFNKRQKRSKGIQKAERPTDSPVKPLKSRPRMVGYVYEPVVTLTSESQMEQQGEQAGTPVNTELASTDSTPAASGRSSRVIKTPKRFLDDERMAHLAPRNTLKKNGIGSATPDPDAPRLAGHKRRYQHHEGDDHDHVTAGFQEDHSTSDAPRSKSDQQALSPEEGKVKFFERLKKLTATLDRKREQRAGGTPGIHKVEEEAEGEAPHSEETQGPVKKRRRRRRSKLTMEDIQAPGVVRKLAVHLSAIGATIPGAEPLDASTGEDVVEGVIPTESDILTQKDLGERILVEQEGTTHRISVSSSNKRMFHLLKRAKVQLIKIDQQKQLKSSQLLSGSVKLGESSETVVKRRRRRRRMGRPPNRDAGARQQNLLAGPRIKHVCRAAAVALGQPRAMVPDDIPRLSALPMHEREGIAPSPTAEAGGGEASDPESGSDSEWGGRKKGGPRSEYCPGGVRLRRCMDCEFCLKTEDCGQCMNCLDKPKFGGPNTRRQCCIYRVCSRIALKKAKRMGIRNPKVQVRRGGRSSASANASSEDEDGAGAAHPPRTAVATSDLQTPSPSRKQPRRNVTPLCYSDLLRSESEEESDEPTTDQQQQQQPAPRRTPLSNETTANPVVEEGGDVIRRRRGPFGRGGLFGRGGRRRFDKQSPPSQARDFPPSPSSSASGGGGGGAAGGGGPICPSLKLKLRLQLRLERLPPSVVRAAASGEPLPPLDSLSSLLPSSPHHRQPHQQQSSSDGTIETGAAGSATDSAEPHQAHAPCFPPPPQSATQHSSTPPNALAALANRFYARHEMASRQANVHRVRIDFKEDCSVHNVWLMGGLSVLTSIPIAPDSVCLLCASKGKHEMVYCQVCCEPFHSFCLKEEERPQEANKENWCCRRCKYCHVCGRRGKHSRPVLQCRRCLYCYHPTCLGPTYPKPLKCNLPWVCMKCIRCKSCGMTPGKTWDMAWNHQHDLCPDCSVLHKLGNFCPVCQCCYEETGCRKHMLKCARCGHWVHSKCEKISDEECERMKRRAVGGFICTPCGLGNWRAELHDELSTGLQTVMAALLDSPHTQDVLTCEQCETCSEDVFEKRDTAVCDLLAVGRKLEKGDYTTVRAFSDDVALVMRKNLKGEEESPPDEFKSLYLQLMKEAFSWLNGGHLKMWEPISQDYPSGMLPEAVLPPSDEHCYAQWMERDIFPTQGTKGVLSPGQAKRLFQDSRQCSLCQQHGDGMPNEAGRLLYLGQNEWAHVNCCMWSAEVQEDKGALLHVHSAVARGRQMRCDRCGLSGATVGCCLSTCQSNYHFMCARVRNCVFQEDQIVYCHKHSDLLTGKEVTGSGFEVLRRIYVDFEGFSLRRKFLTGLEPEIINMMIGSLQIHHLGVLTELSANSGKLFPLGYKCSRWYWSTVNPYVRCKYTCEVREVQPCQVKQETQYSRCQGSNQTISHSPAPVRAKAMESADSTARPVEIPVGTPSPKAKQDSGARSSGYSHTRRPVGGFSRPLPSPGNAGSKSHHILTISDLDETRRPRRLSTNLRGRNASPPRAEGSSLLPRSLPFRSPNRSSPSSPTSPLATSALSPHHATVSSLPATLRHSPRIPQPFRVSHPEPAEVPQDFLGSSEPQDAAMMPSNDSDVEANADEQDILLVADELCAHTNADKDTVILVTDHQGVPYGHLDVDAEEAVASVLSAKLDLDEALQDMVLQYRVQTEVEEEELRGEEEEGGGGGGMEVEVVQSVEESADACISSSGSKELSPPNSAQEMARNDSSDDDCGGDDNMGHYLNFSRTVVLHEAPKDVAETSLSCLPTSGTISQLDGADNESESDAGEITGEDESQETGRSSQNLESDQSSSGSSSSEEHDGNTTSSASRFALATSDSVIDLADDSSDESSTDSVTMDEDMPMSTALMPRANRGKTRLLSNPRVRLIETSSAPTHITVTAPVTASVRQSRKKIIKITTTGPVGRARNAVRGAPRGRARNVGRARNATPTASVGRARNISPNAPVGRARNVTPTASVGRARNITPAAAVGRAQNVIPTAAVGRAQNVLPAAPPGQSPNVTITVPIGRARTVIPVAAASRTRNITPTAPVAQARTVIPAAAVGQSPNVTPTAPVAQSRTVIPAGAPGQARTVTPTAPVANVTPTAPVVQSQTVIPAASSPVFRAVPLKDPLTSAPIVINGFGSTAQQSETLKGKPIAIRLTAPKQPIAQQHQHQQQQQTQQGVVASGTSPAPQILLVNRFGQILVKDPQSNTYQSPDAASPSLNNISQIAKIIHSRNVLPRPVPKILVAPVSTQSTVVSQNVGVTTHIISYTSRGGSAPTNVCVRKLNMPDGAQPLAQPRAPSQSAKPSAARTKNVTVPLNGRSQAEMAQSIIDKAMASHRDMLRSPNLSPSQFTVHPFLNKLESPQPIVTLPSQLAAPSQQKRTKPAILTRSGPQVRVKRVSSVCERVGVKRCRTDFLPPTPPVAVEDPSSAASRASGVRMKTPSSKDILDLDQSKLLVDCPAPPKPEIPKPPEPKRETTKEGKPVVPQGANGGVPAKTHVWVSARDGDLSDWGPYSGLSSDDEDSSPPKQPPSESPRKDQIRLSFVITSDDGFKVEADSIELAWRAVLEGVQEARIGCGMRQLPVSVLSGAQLLGVVHNSVIYLLEQLQGAAKCRAHRFRFHQQEKPEEELPINPSGCARAEVYQRKSTFDMFDFLASQHRWLPEYTVYDEEEDDLPLKSTRRATNSELPVAMRFRHLKRTSKEAVGVYRSPIHGRGLFCKRNIEAGEMVIEYAGNVIRSVLTDKREKHYDRKGIGCYMFRIDDFDVVDATMHGNAARFINHSCEPNCYSRVISVDGQKHIVIFALRKVHRGEELTYDYKFPKEDADSKLHCNCGARRCRRFLN